MAADIYKPRPQNTAEMDFIKRFSGFYFASRTGVGKPDDTRFDSSGTTLLFETEYKIGTYSSAALGYRFASLGVFTPRIELEGGLGRFSVDRQTINGTQQESVDSFGNLTWYSGFANGFLDLDLGRQASGPFFSAIRPFVGGGVGLANVKLEKQGASATGTVIDSNSTKFAYHLSGGVGIDLAQLGFDRFAFTRNTTLEIGYRRLEIPDLSFISRDGTDSLTSVSIDMVTVGFRRQF
jgi:opacity protein-like surface antigen